MPANHLMREFVKLKCSSTHNDSLPLRSQLRRKSRPKVQHIVTNNKLGRRAFMVIADIKLDMVLITQESPLKQWVIPKSHQIRILQNQLSPSHVNVFHFQNGFPTRGARKMSFDNGNSLVSNI